MIIMIVIFSRAGWPSPSKNLLVFPHSFIFSMLSAAAQWSKMCDAGVAREKVFHNIFYVFAK